MISTFLIDLIKTRLIQFPTNARGWSYFVAGGDPRPKSNTNFSNFFETVLQTNDIDPPVTSSEVIRLLESALSVGRYDAVSIIMSLGFTWSYSPEGYDFWLPIALTLKSRSHDDIVGCLPYSVVDKFDLVDYTEMALNNFVWAKRQ